MAVELSKRFRTRIANVGNLGRSQERSSHQKGAPLLSGANAVTRLSGSGALAAPSEQAGRPIGRPA